MRIICLGTGPFAVPALRALVGAGHDVLQVITRPPRGRKGDPPAPMAAAASELGLPVWAPESINLPESQQRLRELNGELLVVCDYGEILKDATLALTTHGGINLHGSLLPRYRGAAPVQWAVLNGDTHTGNTVIQMTPGLDAGPILGQQTLAIDPDETAGELESRLATAGAELTLQVVAQLANGTAVGQPQDKSQATKALRLDKAAGLVDWSASAEVIKNRVRGLHPWPRAYTFWRRESQPAVRLVLDRVSIADTSTADPPGTVLESGKHLLIATGSGVIEIHQLQPAGKRSMTAAEYLRGAPIAVGDSFGNEVV